MAVSLVGSMRKLGDKKQAYFDAAANIAAALLPRFLQSGSLLWNVNIPALPQEQIRGVRFTPLARQIYDGTYVEREDPRDRRYFWTPVSVHYTHDTQTGLRYPLGTGRLYCHYALGAGYDGLSSLAADAK